ncbi:hypothetical protein Axi01nite_97100 [Actinoplanes xinjiangensis]|nr:hypothetical protein Axi01nite_97100 [Actinoplanes xinjiangensis]
MDLHGADLRSANRYGVDLTAANLSGADLTGAELSGAELAVAQLDAAAITADQMRSAASNRCAQVDKDIAEELDMVYSNTPVCQGELRPAVHSKSAEQGEFRIEKR